LRAMAETLISSPDSMAALRALITRWRQRAL
jgi:hypothetical protein